MRARVDGDVAVLERPPEDDAQRHQRIPDRRRVAPLGEEIVGELLDVKRGLGEEAFAHEIQRKASAHEPREPLPAHWLDVLLADGPLPTEWHDLAGVEKR